MTLCGLYAGFATLLDALGLLPPADTSIWDGGGTAVFSFLIALGPALALSWALGELPGRRLTATALRPFATAAEMEAGLSAGQPDTWRIRIALKWASLLYGRPLSYVSDGT